MVTFPPSAWRGAFNRERQAILAVQESSSPGCCRGAFDEAHSLFDVLTGQDWCGFGGCVESTATARWYEWEVRRTKGSHPDIPLQFERRGRAEL